MEGRAAGLPHGLDESIPISPIQKWRLSVNIILIPVFVLLFALCYKRWGGWCPCDKEDDGPDASAPGLTIGNGSLEIDNIQLDTIIVNQDAADQTQPEPYSIPSDLVLPGPAQLDPDLPSTGLPGPAQPSLEHTTARNSENRRSSNGLSERRRILREEAAAIVERT